MSEAINNKEAYRFQGTAAQADVTTSPTDTTSGRVTKVGDFGVGGLGVPSPSDLNDINEGGLYSVESGILNNPSGQLGTLLHVNFRSVNAAVQTFYNLQADQVFYRRELNGIWEPWQELYHTGNLNPNEFGGLAANNFEVAGNEVSSTIAEFRGNILSNTLPSSITVQGTFNVLRPGVGVVASGITPTLNTSESSSRIAIFRVEGLTGLVNQEQLHLRGDSSTAKITVNF